MRPCRVTLRFKSDTLIESQCVISLLHGIKHNCPYNFNLRWLDWIFFWGGGGGYLLSLSINYVAMSKDMEKRFPQLYYVKMKISYDVGFYCIRSRHGNVTMPLRFLFIFVFLCAKSFFKKSLKGVCTCHNSLNYDSVFEIF